MNVTEKKKIMVIDDDEFIAEIVKVSLEMTGEYSITVCSSGQEALDKLVNYVPDLIIQDLLLEDMDGIDLIQLLKQREQIRNIPIIILTGSDESSVRRNALQAGAALYVQKPFIPQELIRNIRILTS